MTDEKETLIARIISEALGNLEEWEIPIVKPSLGPSFPELADEYHEQLCALKKELHDLLEQYTIEGLTQTFCRKNHNGRFSLSDRHGVFMISPARYQISKRNSQRGLSQVGISQS